VRRVGDGARSASNADIGSRSMGGFGKWSAQHISLARNSGLEDMDWLAR